MQLKDIQFLTDVARDYGISVQTLHSRLKNLKEEEEYRRNRQRQSIILTPGAVEKLVQGKEKIKGDNDVKNI